MKKILVLAPHTDDGEWGAGASIHKWKQQGAQILHIALSDCEESLPKTEKAKVLREEFILSNKILGIEPGNEIVWDYPVRYFSSCRQDILENFIKVRGEFQPNVVICPSSQDTHQDHAIVREEAFRAFKRSTILGFEMPWNNRQTELGYYVKVSQHDITVKQQAIAAYKSQIFRAPNFEDIIFSLATVRGAQIGVQYSEAFEAIRVITE